MFAIYTKLCRFCLLILLFSALLLAQENNAASASAASNSSDLSQQVIELRALVQKLQVRVDELEKRSQAQPEANAAPAGPPSQPANAAPQQ